MTINKNGFVGMISNSVVSSVNRIRRKFTFEQGDKFIVKNIRDFVGLKNLDLYLIESTLYCQEKDSKLSSLTISVNGDNWYVRGNITAVANMGVVGREMLLRNMFQMHNVTCLRGFSAYDHLISVDADFSNLVEDVDFGGEQELPDLVYKHVYNDDEKDVCSDFFSINEENVYENFKKHVDVARKGPSKRSNNWKCPYMLSDYKHTGDFKKTETPAEVLKRKTFLPIVTELPKINSVKSDGTLRTIISMSRGLYALQWKEFGVINKSDTDKRVIKNLSSCKPIGQYYDISSCDEKMLKYVWRYGVENGCLDILCPYIYDKKNKVFKRVNKFASGMLVTKLFVECFVLAVSDAFGLNVFVQGDGFMSDSEMVIDCYATIGVTVRVEDVFNGFEYVYGEHYTKPHVKDIGYYWRYTRADAKLRTKRYRMKGRINGLTRRHLLEYIYIYYLKCDYLSFSPHNPFKDQDASAVFTYIQDDVTLRRMVDNGCENVLSNVIEDYPVTYTLVKCGKIPRIFVN
jgi:hypothetical protein